MEPTLVRRVANELRFLRFKGYKCCDKYKNMSEITSMFHHCDFPLMKDRLLRRLCFEATVKCSFSDHGCQFTGKVLEVSSHERCCDFLLESRLRKVQLGDDSENSTTKEADIVQDSSGQSMEELIVAELECPICNDCMKPPVRQCFNGHAFCTDCTDRVPNCPICRGPKSVEVNISLGYFYLAVEVPCRNAAFGCDVSGRGKEVEIHERSCRLTPRLCPLSELDFCRWKGLTSDMAEHCKSEHSNRLLIEPEHKWDNNGFLVDMGGVNLFYIYGVIFKCTWSICRNELMFSLSYIADEPIHDRFTYETEISINGSELTSAGGECSFIDDSSLHCIYNDSKKLLNSMYDSARKRHRDFAFAVKIFDSTDKKADYNY